MNTLHYHAFRYIFEAKETKQTESKGKKTKDAKGESEPQGKVIARLQVGANQFIFSSLSLLFIHLDLFGPGLNPLLEISLCFVGPSLWCGSQMEVGRESTDTWPS